jgi:GTP pyrophosphokinase
MCLTKKDKGFNIELLVLSPESSHITEDLAGELGHNSVERIRKNMRIARDNLNHLAEQNANFRVKWYDETPNFKILMFDDIMFVSSFAGGGPKNDRNAKMSIEMLSEIYVAVEELIETAQTSFPSGNWGIVRCACDFAQKHYRELIHPTNRSYIQYAVTVAKYLAETGSEPGVVAAALICPPPSIEGNVLDVLRKNFKGEDELLELVEEVLQISQLEERLWPSTNAQPESRERKEILRKMFLLAIDEARTQTIGQNPPTAVHFQKKERQLENLRGLFLAAATDIHALVIKLVDRLYFIKFIKDLSPTCQQAMNYQLLAKITLEIYAPLADRLGMWRLKSELEDMSFRLLNPGKYRMIVEYLAAKKQERERYITDIIPLLKNELEAFGIKAQIFGRAKHIYSIYQKMDAKQVTFDQINDLLGIRIIVDTSEDCYNAQGVLHELYQPLTEVYEGKAGRDWIANPKENLYQSLHTTVRVEGKAVEVQIRTPKMHEIAEYGVTALKEAVHWRYKESKTYSKAKTPRVKMRRVRDTTCMLGHAKPGVRLSIGLISTMKNIKPNIMKH